MVGYFDLILGLVSGLGCAYGLSIWYLRQTYSCLGT